MTSATTEVQPKPNKNRGTVKFILLFVGLFVGLVYLLDGTGPVQPINQAIHQFTLVQTQVAGGLLNLVGQSVTAAGNLLIGPTFSCEVETGCNGMSAVVLLLAGLLSFPAPWRHRLAGLAVLLPAVILVNILRIAGLYWVGEHASQWFGPAHVYVGQVLVITVTAGLWWGWLSWSARRRAASS